MRTTALAGTVAVVTRPILLLAAAQAIGDYVAAGLGIIPSSVSTTTLTPAVSHPSAPYGNGTSSNSTSSLSVDETPKNYGSLTDSTSWTSTSSAFSTESTTATSSNILAPMINSTISSNNSSSTFPQFSSFSNTTSGLNGTNATLDTCWSQWTHHWSILDQVATTYLTTAVVTSVGPIVSDGTTLYTVWSTYPLLTTTIWDGAHPIATTAYTFSQTFSTVVSSTYGISTVTREDATSIWTVPYSEMTNPPCTLPSSVPQCQSSWNSWESAHWEHDKTVIQPDCVPRKVGTTPINQSCLQAWSSWFSAGGSSAAVVGASPRCTQATVSSDYCSKEVSRFIGAGSYLTLASTLKGWTVSTQPNGDVTTVWPATRDLVPGCKLGCQQCRITGSSVEMFFWPPQTASVDPDAGPVTAVTWGTTFTSPTVYISFDTLFASDSCSAVGQTYSSTILAIPQSTDISSLWGMDWLNGLPSTAAFNFSDLIQTPIPQTIFNRQPRCWHEWWWQQDPLPSDLDHYNCSHDYPYNPILVLPDEVRNVDPTWAYCVGGIEGVYDPPIALKPASTVAQATLPNQPAPTEPAAPAPSLKSPAPVQTSTKQFTYLPNTPSASSPSPSKPDPTSKAAANSPSEPSPAAPKFTFDPETTAASSPKSTPQQDQDPGTPGSNQQQPAAPSPNDDPGTSNSPSQSATPNSPSPNNDPAPAEDPSHPQSPNNASPNSKPDTPNDSPAPQKPATIAVIPLGSGSVTAIAVNKPQTSEVAAHLEIGGHTLSVPVNVPVPPELVAHIEIGGQTLSVGQVTTIQNQVVTVGSNAIVVDGSQTVAFSQVTLAPQGSAPASAVRVEATGAIFAFSSGASQAAPITAIQTNGVVKIDGLDLKTGASAVVSGHTYQAQASAIVVDGSTVAMSTIPAVQTSVSAQAMGALAAAMDAVFSSAYAEQLAAEAGAAAGASKSAAWSQRSTRSDGASSGTEATARPQTYKQADGGNTSSTATSSAAKISDSSMAEASSAASSEGNALQMPLLNSTLALLIALAVMCI